ncbi:MAG: hypothetical protein QOD26_2028 [Betaproteobacteria bacterium]|jgi:hypothetical protein|nr:hypothetical protein [Betaproteobacteria bacterium]
MGFLDALKKLIPENKPPFTVEPQCLKDMFVTLLAPTGWQISHVDNYNFRISGPGGCTAEFFITRINGKVDTAQVERNRAAISKVQRDFVLKGDVQESVLPNGVLWMEQVGKEGLHVVAFNLKPRIPGLTTLPGIDLNCKMPAGAPFRAERLEALRGMLRSAQWN